jgi:molybdenum cofactor cytidylyltransferase
MPQTALILLAAGASIRMGQPKQLLPFQGKPLIRHIVDVGIASACHPIIIVLGANAPQIEPLLQNLPVHLVHNREWAVGMSRSIQCGIQYLLTFLNDLEPEIDSAILSVCDQPFIIPSHLDHLIHTYRLSQKQFIASEYHQTWGVPALFDRQLFPELLALQGEGAKPVIQRHQTSGLSVPFPQGYIDIDTPDDYHRYASIESKESESKESNFLQHIHTNS